MDGTKFLLQVVSIDSKIKLQVCVDVGEDGGNECCAHNVKEIPPERARKGTNLRSKGNSGANKRPQLRTASMTTNNTMSANNIVGLSNAATVSNTPMKYGYTFASVVVPAE